LLAPPPQRAGACHATVMLLSRNPPTILGLSKSD
jgi:hypothetical protein